VTGSRPSLSRPARDGWSGCWKLLDGGEIAVENADKFTIQFAKKKANKFALENVMENSYSE
jgi:hypothetical protein